MFVFLIEEQKWHDHEPIPESVNLFSQPSEYIRSLKETCVRHFCPRNRQQRALFLGWASVLNDCEKKEKERERGGVSAVVV